MSIKQVNRVLKNLDRINITSDFGEREDPITHKKSDHNGIDIPDSGNNDDVIVAIASGEVKVATKSSTAGNYVQIKHAPNKDGKTVYTRYLHMKDNSLKVSKGDIIEKGKDLGIIGTTGRSTGVHLHFDVAVGGEKNYVDPKPYIEGKLNIGDSNESIKSYKVGDKIIIKGKLYFSNASDNVDREVGESQSQIYKIAKEGNHKYGIIGGYDYNENNIFDSYVRWIDEDAIIRKFDSNTKDVNLTPVAPNSFVNILNHYQQVNREIYKDFIESKPSEYKERYGKLYKRIHAEEFECKVNTNIKIPAAKSYDGYTARINAVSNWGGNSESEKQIGSTFKQTSESIVIEYYYDQNTYQLTYDSNGGYTYPDTTKPLRINRDIIYNNEDFILEGNKEFTFTKDNYEFIGWSTSKNGEVDNAFWGLSHVGNTRNWQIPKNVTLYAQYKRRIIGNFLTSESLLPDFYKTIDGANYLGLTEYADKYTNLSRQDITKINNINNFHSNDGLNDNYTIIKQVTDTSVINYFPYFQSILTPFIDNNVGMDTYIALKGCFPTFEQEHYRFLYNKNYELNDACTYVVERTDDALLIESMTGNFKHKIPKDDFKDRTVPYQLLAIGCGAGGQGGCLVQSEYGSKNLSGGNSGAASIFLINLFDAKAYITIGNNVVNINDSEDIGKDRGADGKATKIKVISNSDESAYAELILDGGFGGSVGSNNPKVASTQLKGSKKELITRINYIDGVVGKCGGNGDSYPFTITELTTDELY